MDFGNGCYYPQALFILFMVEDVGGENPKNRHRRL